MQHNTFAPAFSKSQIADLNTKFAASDSFAKGKQLAFEEGAFLALEAIARVTGKSIHSTDADFARLEQLVLGDR